MVGNIHYELAFHEAGHAIVAALLGQGVEWVAINKENGCGEAEPTTNPFFRLDEPFESRRRVIIAMAGSAAQCRCIGRDFQWTLESEGDKRLAEDNAERARLSPADFSVISAVLSQGGVWEKVSELAVALCTHGQLFSWNGLKELLPERDASVCKIVGIPITL